MLLLHPGFPIIKIGIFDKIQVNKENKFSFKVLFNAIPFGIFIFSHKKLISSLIISLIL